ncbi:putative tRNA(5-methylaminomethyl-2-thiouridylate) methyltransferase [Candidatus Carsonella ruddii PV]|uniref:Putative tRNA(5-methylaminomethyl-2-thiouridylate) methyltransferase n=1 Tax=Carsonella ruddii (strain PV) TaxID=387662 RepID=Q05FV4_CARRP|nr:tRNA (5-methylaminomethyl-2-thiouridylate)-methyltransferase [Candidatus Carsonella ruddii]BAF35067.1 putative tRNA(5-methylaminomethyl-2-thiouridylate) methyltransferase [Candidatus Carsonella ruddii PV]
MLNFLLNSGGKDSNYSSILVNNNNIFIKIDNFCENLLDKKYLFLNCIINKKKILIINLKNEYNFFFDFKNSKFIFYNLDFYCNKFIKINLVKQIIFKLNLLTGHYFRIQKNFFFVSIDQKKDQCYFLNFKKKIHSNIGFFNKLIITYITKKKNFVCKCKKSTTGICFKINKNFFFCNYYVFENKNIFETNYCKLFYNLGQLYKKNFIVKIKYNQIIISKYNYLSKTKILILKLNFNYSKICKIKINSQNIFKNAKIIFNKKKCYLICYKFIYFIEKNQNCLIKYNELIISNIIIKKKN